MIGSGRSLIARYLAFGSINYGSFGTRHKQRRRLSVEAANRNLAGALEHLEYVRATGRMIARHDLCAREWDGTFRRDS